MSGQEYPGLESFDATMIRLLDKWSIPGGALAVSRHGHLLLCRGYGYADRDKREQVTPDSLFRLASLSKAITSAAILKLVDNKVLSLDQKVLPILGNLVPNQSSIVDGRIRFITIRQLLHHTGGFDSSVSGDPMFMPRAAVLAQLSHSPMPADKYAIIAGVLQQPLDHDPGSTYSYSNVGFNILGRVIEKASGMPYEDFIRKNLFAQIGVSMFQGQTLKPHRQEVHYYDFPGAGLAEAEPGLATGRVAWPYGGFYLEAMDSHGAWISSVPQYLRFWLALFGGRGKPLLSPSSKALLCERPADISSNKPVYYGCGIQVRVLDNGGLNCWHTGSLSGTTTLAVHAANGLDWVVAFNSRPRDRNGFERELDDSIWQALRSVKQWPEGDLWN